MERVLRSSGWFPGRQVDIQAWREGLAEFSWHVAAERFLAEFGGISVNVSGPGITVAREPFDVDPELAVGEEERFEELSDRFGRRFFPVGEFREGEFLLGIDEDGILYSLGAWAFSLGTSDKALGNLIEGVRGVRLNSRE
ncbi:SUKH-3 domain-containing protein [Streptomyces sp. NPDC097704]|uniref:SUKH-3 domain-containing protein n=1 Tax=Streptomyces sp. NPDC097704 TaxID=3157101 RepID=UPI003317C0B8